MPDEVLKFNSEAEKTEAIAKFDELLGKPEDLEKIMAAPVEAPATPPEPIVPEGSEPEKSPTETPPEKVPEKVSQDEKPAEKTVSDWDTWAKEQGFTSVSEAAKALGEMRENIKKQRDFIDEKLTAMPAYAAPASVAPAPVPAPAEMPVSTIKIDDIKKALLTNASKKRDLISRLRAEPSLYMDTEFLGQQADVDEEKLKLDSMMADELSNLRTLHDNVSQQLTSFTKAREDDTRREQNERMRRNDMDEITRFSSDKNHPEFMFSEGKNSDAVETEYVVWANKIATALYGQPVNMLRSQQELEAVASALNRLGHKDPEVMNVCQIVGVPTEPSSDIQKYLDICELLDLRDGIKKDPVTGQKVQQTRMIFDKATGQFKNERIILPSLEDAYKYRMAIDGTFSKKIKEAYTKGGADMASAAAKRTAAPVQMGNAKGVSKQDAGLEMTAKDALEILGKFDESEAMRRKLSGDSSMLDEYNKAVHVMETVKF